MKMNDAIDQFVKDMGATPSTWLTLKTGWEQIDGVLVRAKRMVAQTMAYETAQDRAGEVAKYDFSRLRDGTPTISRLCCVWDRPSPPSAGHRVMLRHLLSGLGLHPDETSHIWAHPFAGPQPPLEAQTAAYLPATLQAIEASGCKYVMLIGGVATHLWRHELQMQQVVNHAAVWKNRWWVYPVLSPIVPLTDQTLMVEYRTTMRNLVDMIDEDRAEENMGIYCVEKGCIEDHATMSGVWSYDPDGVPWCRTHYPQGMSRRAKHLGIVSKNEANSRQLGMEMEP